MTELFAMVCRWKWCTRSLGLVGSLSVAAEVKLLWKLANMSLLQTNRKWKLTCFILASIPGTWNKSIAANSRVTKIMWRFFSLQTMKKEELYLSNSGSVQLRAGSTNEYIIKCYNCVYTEDIQKVLKDKDIEK